MIFALKMPRNARYRLRARTSHLRTWFLRQRGALLLYWVLRTKENA